MARRGTNESGSESVEIASVSGNGEVTIPEEFRDELGIDTPGEVEFVRTADGEIVVRPVRSITGLRGVLAGETDERGRSAVERLRAERDRDRNDEAALRGRDEGDTPDERRQE